MSPPTQVTPNEGQSKQVGEPRYAYVLSGHVAHERAPAVAENSPMSHGVQVVAPWFAWDVPGGHGSHAARPDPRATQVLPVPQSPSPVQRVPAFSPPAQTRSGEHVPFGQSEAVSQLSSAFSPPTQRRGDEVEVPGSHKLQAVCPGEDACVPGSQGRHAVDPSAGW